MDFVITKYRQYEKAKSGDWSVTGSILELEHLGNRCWEAGDIASVLQLTTTDLVEKITTGALKGKLFPVDDYLVLSGSECERFKECICASSPLVPKSESLNRHLRYSKVENIAVLFVPAVLAAIVHSDGLNHREVRRLIGV